MATAPGNDVSAAPPQPSGTVLTVRVTRSPQGGKGPRLTARMAQETGPPGLVARGPGPLLELAGRYPEAAILADDPALVAALRPALGGRVGFERELLEEAVAEQIDALARPEIALPSGMTASIHPTPALVAIDMDTAAASVGRQKKQAAQREANRAALPELARQIRLRNLSGAILIDLAGMGAKRRAALAPDFREALASDPLGARFLGFTALGLAEIVRPRVRPPLHELLAGPHAAGLAALRRIAQEGARAPEARLALRAAPDLLAALTADSVALADLARLTGRPLITKSDPALPPSAFRIETE